MCMMLSPVILKTFSRTLYMSNKMCHHRATKRWFVPILMNERSPLSDTPPNTRLQRTPLRVERDRAFFSAGFCYNVTAINLGRRR